MVINIGALRENNDDLVLSDISQVVKAVHKKAKVKVIIETCYLNDEEKRRACRLAVEAGADFVKTSTGMGTGGATEKDIRLMVNAVDGKAQVKASGGVDTRKIAYSMLKAGASRLGVSKVPQIVEDDTSIVSASKKNQPPKYC